MVGIVSYGAYVPSAYVNAATVHSAATALGVVKKSQPFWDEDSLTMGVEAAKQALDHSPLSASSINALYLGSEETPYAVKAGASMIADCLNLQFQLRTVDLQSACKAATTAVQSVAALLASKHISLGLVVGSDVASAQSGDVLSAATGAGAAALLLGRTRLIARLVDTVSVSSDTPDFWRREGQSKPSHAGRFSGESGYFHHVTSATELLLKRQSLKAKDIDHVVFHMPNAVFPKKVACQLGFCSAQLKSGLIVSQLGNCYSASALLGFLAVLDQAQAHQRIVLTSYGSGAGADSFLFTTTPAIKRYPGANLKNILQQRVAVGQELHD